AGFWCVFKARQGASRGAYPDRQLLMQPRRRTERQARMGIYLFPSPVVKEYPIGVKTQERGSLNEGKK
ncbi:MAG: hypothetical protein LWX52_16050, partial [Deltaproteobacteria bacterium]|nr:hypothetical protein [Deltaproteobacteria bacterium]